MIGILTLNELKNKQTKKHHTTMFSILDIRKFYHPNKQNQGKTLAVECQQPVFISR